MSDPTDNQGPTRDTRLQEVIDVHSKAEEVKRSLYKKNLATFSPATYFAKPPSLSPVVCARFGWKNTKKDLLECDQCGGALAIFHPSTLSLPASQKLTSSYEERLSTSHKDSCVYRGEATLYRSLLMDQQTGTETVASKPLVPLLLSSILPSLSRSLLDDPRPKPVFLDYWKQAFERLSTVDDSDLPDLETDLPEDLNQCLDAVLEIVGPTIEATSGTQDAREDSKRSRLAACTVLLGWLPQQSAENESQLSGAWECPFCLASFDIPGSCRNENEPTSKRQRTTRSPYSCHRHYCPFVCGFCIQGASSGEPLWKGLCERIQAAPEVAAERADDAYRELHRLLRSSVSPRFRKALSSSVGAGKS